MSSVIPEGWSRIQIGDIGSFFGGLTGKTAKDFGDGHPFLTYMQVYSQQTSDMEAMNSVLINEGEKQNTVAYGDVLFTISSETPDEIGMTDVFLGVNQTPYLNSFCFGLRPITPLLIDPTFGKYVFRGDDFREDMRPLAQGSTRFNLSKGNLAKLSLLIPSLPEQKKIASILTSVDGVIENTQKQIDKLQDLKKATMNELLTKGIGHTEFKDSELGRIPKSWEVVTLKDVCEKLKPGPFGSAITKSMYVHEGYKVYGQEQVISGDITIGDYYIPESKYEELTAFKVQASDVLISLVGTIGKSLIVPDKHFPGIINPRLIILRLNKTCIPIFMQYLLSSEDVQRQLSLTQQGGTMGVLSASVLKPLKLRIPPIEEQESITEVFSSLDNRIGKLDEKLTQTQSLKKSLMQDLLTGKVRVTLN